MSELTPPPGDLLLPAQGVPTAPTTAAEAVETIRAWHAMLAHIRGVAEAALMHAAWTIREEYPERAAWDDYLSATLPRMDSGRLWLMAETWEVARRQRAVRELVDARPHEAVTLVAEFAGAGAAAQLSMFDDDDRALADMLAMPPRQRRQAMRRLIADARAAGDDHHPDDLRRIEELEQATVHEPPPAADPRRRAKQVVDALAACEQGLARLADDIEALVAAGGLGRTAQDRVMRLADMVVANADRISTAVGGDGTDP